MITAGIDVGIESLKAVVLKDGKVIARGTGLSGGANRAQSVEQVWNEMLKSAMLLPSNVSKVVATGQGKADVKFAAKQVVEPIADAKAARFLYPSVRTVVDVGADQTRVVTLDQEGKLLEAVMNEKCYAGLGIYLKTMARTLGISIEEISNSPGYAEDQCGSQRFMQCFCGTGYSGTDESECSAGRHRAGDNRYGGS